MRREESGKGSGFRNRLLKVLKMAALPATPSASMPTTIKLNPGFLRMPRQAIRKSYSRSAR